MPKSKSRKPNLTPISRRKYQSKVIRSPLAALSDTGVVKFSSWLDDFLSNVLWAAVLAGNLKRDIYLEIFRDIVGAAQRCFSNGSHASLCHNFLRLLSQADFNQIFEPILRNEAASTACQPLAHLESLPDASHWRSFLKVSDLDHDPNPLVRAVTKSLDHQSQEATDVRWLKVVSFIAFGKIRMPEDKLMQFVNYPSLGDMRMVRPSIRAMEMALRTIESGSERPKEVPEPNSKRFWDEMLKKTPCVEPSRRTDPFVETDAIRVNVNSILEDICNHFMDNISSTAVDPKLDGAFGIVINVLALTRELTYSGLHQFITGRLVLRSIVESFITLKYLSQKDDLVFWMQYRNYGSGQSALAFLKNTFGKDVPDVIDINRLEILANEDAWIKIEGHSCRKLGQSEP